MVHVPVVALSVCPSTVLPDTVGAIVLTGGGSSAVTAAVAGAVALAVPPSPLAVTTSSMRFPTSAAARVYVEAVAPAMFVQVVPQSRHW